MTFPTYRSLHVFSHQALLCARLAACHVPLVIVYPITHILTIFCLASRQVSVLPLCFSWRLEVISKDSTHVLYKNYYPNIQFTCISWVGNVRGHCPISSTLSHAVPPPYSLTLIPICIIHQMIVMVYYASCIH